MATSIPRRVAPLGLSSVVLVLCAFQSLGAQSGAVRGRVTDEGGHPLPGAQIEIVGTGIGAAVRADGTFDVRAVPVGSQTVRARLLGRRAAVETVRIQAGATVNVELMLAADPLALDVMVVSGTFNPASKLESSTAITTMSPQEVEQRAPRGTAELLKGVPGLQVMSNSGETGADVTVRGLPQTANSSFRYISLQEDGLPAFEAPGLLFAFPDAMVRLDETVARVEAVRGGSAAVFGSSTPGGIVNVISKTGGPSLAGTIRSATGAQGMERLDANVGGPLFGAWRFNVGGYYRYDRGVRDPGFPANEGGQVRANATRDESWGHVRVYGKYLNERNLWYLGIPIRNFRDPQAIPGGPQIGSGTTFARERLTLTVPDAYNPGSTIQRDMNGNTTRYSMAGVDLLRALGRGWSLTFRGKALHSDNVTNLMIDVADPMPISTFGPPLPKQVRYVNGGETITDPAKVATLNGNGLMSVHGLAFVNQPVTNGIANVELARQGANHSVTGGVYFSGYTTRLKLLQQGIFLEVADNPRMIQVGVAGQNGAFTGLTPADGFAGYNSGFWNLKNRTSVGALYLGDSWHASDRLNVDLGARVDQNWSNGRNERPVNPGRVVNGQVTGQVVPAGYAPFTPTAQQSQAGLFGSGIYRTWDYTFSTWSASAGANYRLSDHLAVYGRGSRGTRIPTSQQWTFQTSDGSQITGQTNRGEVETTLQGELGVKASTERWSLLATGFYGSSKNLITTLQRGQANGSFSFLPISGDTRTIGVELEGAVSPLNGLQLRAVSTLQDPRFTRFRYEFFVPGSNPGSGPQVRDYSGNKLNDAVSLLGDLTASYTHAATELFGTVRYTGDRAANRPNTVTVPGFSEINGGVAYRFRQSRVALQGLNLLNRQAIVQMAARTGEDILRVNADGTAESLVTTGAAAGTTSTSQYTTGLGILPRSVQLSVTYEF
ncbi:MAG: TonB-dependent receptor [Gemmatimonadetes bacterium]|nr:TonB-dependent receptor [Gemmatimonadota bacterium]